MKYPIAWKIIWSPEVHEDLWVPEVKVILLTFVQAHSDLDSFTSSPLGLLGQLKQNFIWRLHRLEEQRFFHTIGVTWQRWLPCPYMVKTFKNRLLWKQLASVIETWYTASGTKGLPLVSSNGDPRLIFDLFTQRSTLVFPMHLFGKCLNGGLLRNYWSLCYKCR